MSWQQNALMYWSTDGTNWNRISDHNRAPIDISYERIEKKGRMVDGTMRRYSTTKKRTFAISWENLPSKITPTYNGRIGVGTVDAGWAGEDIEAFHNTTDGVFYLKLRKGIDEAKAANDGTIETVMVIIGDFSKSIEKRGVVDLWNLSVTLEEV